MNTQITTRPPTLYQSVILDALVDADGHISNDDLIDKLYPNPNYAPVCEKKTLQVHISKLRKILNPPAEIKSVFGVGYALRGVPGINGRSGFPTTIEPTKSEAAVLEMLMDGRWHTRDAIIANLYQYRTTPEAAKKALFIFVMHLRRKLREDLAIENNRQKGYRLIEVKP